ncbi:hypothetical protein ACIQZO_19375 [Streptomyces sp. NPDC097617]|uniref:hypothetical protein n=1 Tax=Streptomyces sp. NPDC097617 TaxID=3366091 RepID=UPI0038160B92
MPRPDYRPDFRLDGFDPVNEAVGEEFWDSVESEHRELTELSAHHSSDGARSFYMIHNGAVTWGIPGEPQLIALFLERDLSTKSYRFDHETLPLPELAQAFLIARGCPAEAIALPPGTGTQPADAATVALQQRLVKDADRFVLRSSHTDDSYPKAETVVLLEAVDERVEKPFRVLLQQADLDNFTHTLREGAFETCEAAVDWMEDRSTPLPAPAPGAVRNGVRAALPSAPPPARGRAR